MAEATEIHQGHRQRLYNSYLQAGLDGFSDIVVLELLLTFAIPRKDTNPIAHGLLNRFGSLYAVFEAPVDSLLQVEGMTKRAAVLLHLQPQLWKRYASSRMADTRIFSTRDACAAYLMTQFRGAREEQVCMMCLDAKCKLLDLRKVSEGSVNSTVLPVRRIVEIALAVNATSVVIAHNHTSGIALPSKEDVQATALLQTALKCVDINLIDHIIVADDDYVSLKDSELF